MIKILLGSKKEKVIVDRKTKAKQVVNMFYILTDDVGGGYALHKCEIGDSDNDSLEIDGVFYKKKDTKYPSGLASAVSLYAKWSLANLEHDITSFKQVLEHYEAIIKEFGESLTISEKQVRDIIKRGRV